MKLSALQIESLCEWADGQRAEGLTWDEIGAKLLEISGKVELPPGTLASLPEWYAVWKKREFRKEAKRAVPVEPSSLEAVAAAESVSDEGGRGQGLLEVLRYLGGELVSAKPVWKREQKYTLREGEGVEYRHGQGESWLHCAVLILQAGRIVRVFPERRIIGKIPAGWNGTRGETLRMEWLSLECEELDREKIITRFAAAMQLHHSGSGLKSAAHLAALTGRTRQAAAAQRAVLARHYYERTEGAAGFAGLSSAPQIRAKAKSHKPNTNKITP